jgi:hypothetical protein
MAAVTTPPPISSMSLCGGVPAGSASGLKGGCFVGVGGEGTSFELKGTGGGGEGTSLELKGAGGGEGSALRRKAPVPTGRFGVREWTTLRMRWTATRAFLHGGGGTTLPMKRTGAGGCGSPGMA